MTAFFELLHRSVRTVAVGLLPRWGDRTPLRDARAAISPGCESAPFRCRQCGFRAIDPDAFLPCTSPRYDCCCPECGSVDIVGWNFGDCRNNRFVANDES